MAPIREQQSSPARHWPWLLVAAIATGTLTFLSFPETDATALAWIALAPLRLALARQRVYGLAAFCWGSLAGLVANLGGFFWIVHLLVVFGHLPLPLALLLCLLLCSYQGLVFGLWAWATTFLAHRLRRVRAPLLDALTFTAAELLVPFIFPWYLGCSQYRFLPVAQLAELTGVAGLSFLLALASGTLVQLLLPLLVAAEQRPARRFLARQAAATVMLTLAVLAWGSFRLAQVERRMAAAPHLRVAMVEGDIGIARKARPEHVADNLAVYQQLSTHAARRGAELIVWPESSYDVRWIHKDTRHIPPSSLPLGGWEQLLGAAPATATDHLVLPGRRALPPARQLPAAGQQVSRCDLVAPQRGFATPLLFGAI
ncbi:MAG: hypothetical protein FJ125_11645, partial [Deltaproteobacteria bacterium]|nr:hypothetical protein [Deltaproteobacteria bacterium]